MSEATAVPEMARSVAHRELPPPPLNASNDRSVTLVLFYQYIEPQWTEKAHKEAIKFVNSLASKHSICGRGRCAREGLNCTLTGSATAVRAFCNGLRSWNPVFLETDFKLTDGLPRAQAFKAFTLRKTEELVAYGLAGERAPALHASRAQHVEAVDYHAMMAQPDTVIVDVRNAYESAIGHFAPPEGGAELIDPKMRNSHEFPKWLNSKETQQKLDGKKVMMYCTGGIRCERATALLDQLEQAADFKTQGVYMVRGGIERYMRTFPEGGYWKGKNYLFDRRFEQKPEKKPGEALRKEVESFCCVCREPWDQYRGQLQCSGKLPPPVGTCGVPVLVCTSCRQHPEFDDTSLLCPLCEEGYVPPQEMPTLCKRSTDDAGQRGSDPSAPDGKKPRKAPDARGDSNRLFLGGLPYLVDATSVRQMLSPGNPSAVTRVEWVYDKQTTVFYGSAFAEFDSIEAAADVMGTIDMAGCPKLKGRKIKVSFAKAREPPLSPDWQESERPVNGSSAPGTTVGALPVGAPPAVRSQGMHVRFDD
ncbi:hypothetical protein AB1Y20_012213 [Prymnesium parvum]|uniref:Rhodanese domain-containing protein n=1 Tax=Prymnesium parvum TaxID=97485 RepID=A0AB34IR59_PRYPA